MEFFFPIANNFNADYTCYSMNFYKNCTPTMQNGGKILLPNSALELLTRLHIQYPMLFKLTNESTNRSTHCGVLEFSADEGKIFAPYWMMINLNIEEGSKINVKNVALEIATFAKFQPLTEDFLNISNPKAVLENALRDFACLTKGDHLAINYNNKTFELKVLETKPQDAISIIECDMQVEFAEPLINNNKDNAAASEMSRRKHNYSDEEDDYQKIIIDNGQKFKVFGGSGMRLDGKIRESKSALNKSSFTEDIPRGVPNYNYKPGLLNFCRTKPANNQGDVEESEPCLFPGEGKTLKERKSRQ